jgi:broad specificity phosphatase PhoE
MGAPRSRRILLARHGETAWNALGRLQGHTDIELNEVGRAQARTLAATVAQLQISAVWTSDLARARQTGEIIARALGLGSPQIDLELRERRFGVFEGLTREQCARRHPEAWRAWIERATAPPGGESREASVERLGRALVRIAERAEGPVLVISHGGVMRQWLSEILGTAMPPIANATVYALEHERGAFRPASGTPWIEER